MALSIDPILDAGINLLASGNKVVIKGNLDCAEPGRFLTPFLSKVHEQALNSGMEEIQVDFSELKFLNSAGITEFSDWIFKIEETEDAKRYKLVFLCNTNEYKWQKSSVQTMVYLNPDICSMKEL